MREPEPYQLPPKSFSDLLNHSRTWKSELRAMSTQNFSKLSLMQVESRKLQVYAIAAAPNTTTQALYTGQVPLSCIDRQKVSDKVLELRLRPAYRAELFNKQTTASAEFALLCERQRAQVVTGVTDYDFKEGSNMVLVAGDQMFGYNPVSETTWKLNVGVVPDAEPMEVSSEGGNHTTAPTGLKGCSPEQLDNHTTTNTSGCSSISATPSVKSSVSEEPSIGFISSARICPSNDKYLAYVLNKQLYIDYKGKVIFRTTSNSKHITNGVPPYIIQEELERYEGIWWSPKKTRLLYEHVNEEAVEECCFGTNGETRSSPMKYPKAGRPNARSTLRMVILDGDKHYDVAIKEEVLRKHAHNYEYITRAGFFTDGTSVWVQLMNRDQSECVLLLVPFTDFELPPSLRGSTPPQKGEQLSTDLNMGHWNDQSHEETMEKPPRGKLVETIVVHRQRSDYWVNVHNAIHPLEVKNQEQPLYEFIYCIEKPNGSVLTLLSAELDENGYCRHTAELSLMSEMQSINKMVGIRVDEERELVYYVANESHPTEWNICVSHYRTGEYAQLTESGLSFKAERTHMKLALDYNHGFVCWVNSVGLPPQCRFYSFEWEQGKALPTAFHSVNITVAGCTAQAEVTIEVPEIIEYQSKRTGLIHYALIIRPPNFDPCKKYPVFHYVYGGPGIQMVHNDFSWVQWSRFSRLGWIVVMMDNRGTANRGIEFESHIHKKLGSVEVEDQVEGLYTIAERVGGFMDLDRVVVHGWSYGGYMALHLLALHPQIYRAAIVGGAVSDWKLYDTAYTERYLGYPVEDHIYAGSSVTRLIHKLPEEPNRLMLIHGLMDENVHFTHLQELVDGCIRGGKWHELLMFPHERHGIRNQESSTYLDARMMFFAQRAITDPSTIHVSGQSPSN